MDVFTKVERSHLMSKIRGKDTKPELIVRKYLHSKGLRFRLHSSNLPGKPDIVLKKYNSVVFVNGCFWHGHSGCKYHKIPKTRSEYWKNKIDRNKGKDKLAIRSLVDSGWNVYVIWECKLKKGSVDSTLINLVKNIRSSS